MTRNVYNVLRKRASSFEDMAVNDVGGDPAAWQPKGAPYELEGVFPLQEVMDPLLDYKYNTRWQKAFNADVGRAQERFGWHINSPEMRRYMKLREKQMQAWTDPLTGGYSGPAGSSSLFRMSAQRAGLLPEQIIGSAMSSQGRHLPARKLKDGGWAKSRYFISPDGINRLRVGNSASKPSAVPGN